MKTFKELQIEAKKYRTLGDIKKAFKKDWAAVKSGRVDIGSAKVEKFYSALFDFFMDSGDCLLYTSDAADE